LSLTSPGVVAGLAGIMLAGTAAGAAIIRFVGMPKL